MLGDIITYDYFGSLYINLTNRCDCRCIFCIRDQDASALGGLWLRAEPTREEVLDEILAQDLTQYAEIVFCGYGEPTERIDTVVSIAGWIKEVCPEAKLRINTNGLGDLVNGRSIAEELCTAVDTVSVSLNAGTEDEYMKVTRPRFSNAFTAMQQFTADCVATGKADVVMSVVDVIPQEQIDASREIAEKLGAVLRVRKFDD